MEEAWLLDGPSEDPERAGGIPAAPLPSSSGLCARLCTFHPDLLCQLLRGAELALGLDLRIGRMSGGSYQNLVSLS